MKKLLIGLSFLILTIIGSLILSNNKNLVNADSDNWVNVGKCVSKGVCDSNAGTQNQTKTTPGYTTPRVCNQVCQSVQFEASHQVIDVASHKEHRHCNDWHSNNGGYCKDNNWGTWTDGAKHGNSSDKASQEERDVAATYKTEKFGPISVQYGDKSNDKNHCHRPTGSSLDVPQWAIPEFNTLNDELSTIDGTSCTGGVWVDPIVETRKVDCHIPTEEVGGCSVDCQLSNWSSCQFEDKEAACGEGTQTREVIQEAENGGEECGDISKDCSTICEEVDPCIENPLATECITPTQEPSATPSATVTPEVTSTPEKPGVEHTGLSVQKLSCTEYDFRAEMEVKNSDRPLQDILVSFTYRGEKKDAYTNKEGYASVYFTFSGESIVKATPINGFESRESMATQETNCQEFGAMSKATDSRVLGANTYAKTGVFEDIMMSVLGLSGATMTAVGATLNVKKRK